MRLRPDNIWHWFADRDLAGIRLFLFPDRGWNHVAGILVYREKIIGINLSPGEYNVTAKWDKE